MSVDYSRFHVTTHRSGPVKFGWVGNVNVQRSAVFELLVPAMGSEFSIHIVSGQESAAEMAAFYNQIDVLLALTPGDADTLHARNAVACGVFLLHVRPAPLPAWVREGQGGMLADATPDALREAMAWCAQNADAVRVGGARNAQNVALAEQGLRGGQDLVILDDIYPLVLSAFRIAEYNAYLEHFKSSSVYSTTTAFRLVDETRPFEAVRDEYEQQFPQFAGRVHAYVPSYLSGARLAYMIFINNAYTFCEALERENVPFVFCLYPGGGFVINGADSDFKLRRVFASPCFRQVICTQRITYDYLIEKGLCPKERITYIQGGVVPIKQIARVERRHYPREKAQFNVCFVAKKYSPRGVDKGYDLFIEAAHQLAQQHPDMHFHVVGDFSPSDIDVSALAGRLTFHGLFRTEQFAAFYADMEIILSPNRPFILSPGSFDGFPTGCASEAASHGVAMFVSDPLKLSTFVDGEELVIVECDAGHICSMVSAHYADPDKLYRIGRNGGRRTAEICSAENQITPRIALLEQFMA